MGRGVRGQGPGVRVEDLAYLRAVPGSDEDDAHARPRAQPTQRQPGERSPFPLRQRAQPLDHATAPLELLALEPVDLASVVAVGELRRRRVLAREQTGRERSVGEKGEASLAAQRQGALLDVAVEQVERDRKSTRLNSSHSQISYAVFCLKKKKL